MNLEQYLKEIDVQKNINRLALKYKNKKAVVYGAGQMSEIIFNNYDLSNINIIAVADKKFNNIENKSFKNIRGISPNDLKSFDYDYIIVANKEYEGIIRYLDDIVDKNIPIEVFTYKSYFDKQKEKQSIRKRLSNNKHIFTFWEPKQNMPAYLKLCVQSWQKYLPDYEVIVLDYSSLENYLGKNYYDEILYREFSLPKQADAIRCALLKKYGGVWFDTDTLLISDKARDLLKFNSKVVMFNTHIGTIAAKKGAKLLRHWEKGIKKNLLKYKFYKKYPELFDTIFGLRKTQKLKKWDYMGNSIVDPYAAKLDKKEFLPIERKEWYALPEVNYYQDKDMSAEEKYTQFYFTQNDNTDIIFQNEHGIIYLHNSWTPPEFRKMNEQEFLNTNTTISKLIKKALYN